MKTISTFFLILSSLVLSAQNYELSTLRIGEFTIFMKKDVAEKMAKKKLKRYDQQNQNNIVSYYGHPIEIAVTENYYGDQNTSPEIISYLATKSKTFRTKSGMGVGSTRQELLNTYKNYPNFAMNISNDEEDRPNSGSIFTLHDYDAGTVLTFKMIDNIVVEVRTYFDECC